MSSTRQEGDLLDRCSFEIRDPDGQHLGTGVLVGPSQLLTCSNVVGEYERVDVIESRSSKRLSGATVSRRGDPTGADNLALLELDTPLHGRGVIRFADWTRSDRFGTVGFPEGGKDHVGGYVLGLSRHHDWLQIDVDGSRKIEPGFSGGAVWVPAKHAAVGLVTHSDHDGVAYAITRAQIMDFWPGLEGATRPLGSSADTYYLSRIQLENIRGFTSLDVQLDAPPRRQSVIIGRNGTCKTTLLRCIALVLAGGKDAPGLLSSPNGRWLTGGKPEGVIRLHLESAKGGESVTRELEIVEGNGGELVRLKEPADDMIFACAYGTGRGDFGGEPGRNYRVLDSVATLFDYGESLVSSELVLRRLLDYLGSERFDAVLSGLKRALGLGREHSIELPRGGGVEISGPDLGGRIPLEAWADGYRMTFSWLIDFYGWAMRAGAFDEAGDVRGILLVDELEQHLHPAMQREILGHLEKVLPRVQIIASTHSPLVALSAKPEQIVALHRDGERVDSVLVPSLDGYSADDALVEEALFGTSPYPPATEARLSRYQELAQIPPEQRSREHAEELGDLARKLDPSSLPTLRDDPVLARLDAIAARLDDGEPDA